MKSMRRFLGILVMCAGVLGLVLSLAGLVTIWVVKPTIAATVDSTISTLNATISTSQQAMQIAGQALGGTVDSVEALSTMLSATATSVQDTQPMLDQLKVFMGEKLPATMESATDSLKAAQSGAAVADSAIKSLDAFRTVLSGVPLIGGFVEPPKQSYNPEKPLADSLGDLATGMQDLPQMFREMAANLDKADDNLATVQTSLTTMSTSVGTISSSLSQYQAMVSQSQASMGNLTTMLTNLQNNLNTILTSVALVLSLFFLWLLAAQVVILSQGWELYQGTAGRMEGAAPEPASSSPTLTEEPESAAPTDDVAEGTEVAPGGPEGPETSA
jgi:ABC-type transporter Mla subunit MlaD